MKDVIVLGAGGHGAEIDEYCRYSQKSTCIKEINIIGFLDDTPTNYDRYKLSAPLIGSISDHKVNKGQYYIIGIANIIDRVVIVNRFKSQGAEFLSLIHCSAYVSESAFIDEGTIIGPNANIGPNVKIGKYNLINSRSSLGHDTRIGDFNLISPNACFSGFSIIGNQNLFGINSATIPGISVGNCNRIAAGMILDQNVGDDSVIFYRFKEKVIAVPRSNNEL